MTIKEQLIAKTEALRTVQKYIKDAMERGNTPYADEVHDYIEQMIASYKQLAESTLEKK